MDGGKKIEKRKRWRGGVAEEVVDATNEVEINANFREEPGQSSQGTGKTRAKGLRANSRKGRRRGGRDGRGTSVVWSRCRRDWKLEDEGTATADDGVVG